MSDVKMEPVDVFEDNMEKYMDPEYYDLLHEKYLLDLPLILEWAGRQGGPIVELACGTGRVTIPLAESGYEVIGVDLNEGMLARAKEKTKDRNLSIQWLLQDCTKLSLMNSSSLMFMTGNSFQHFLTNDSQNKLLQSVHSHLSNEGIFIFGTRFPILSELAVNEETSKTYIDKRNRKVAERNREVYNPLTQILLCTSTREIGNNKEEMIVEEDSISLRYVFPMEMERVIEQNGFLIEHSYRSWDKEPLDEGSSEMVYVCRKQ